MHRYYENLTKDNAGSTAKNRNNIEMLWGIKKLIEYHQNGNEYVAVFDCRCDVEFHLDGNLIEFYQVKTRQDSGSNYTINDLCGKLSKTKSIIGKLYALYSKEHNIKLFLVSNKPLKEKNMVIVECGQKSFNCLPEKLLSKLKETLKAEGFNIDNSDFKNIYYIHESISITNFEKEVAFSLVEFLESNNYRINLKHKAFFNMIMVEVNNRAKCEFYENSYNDILKKKGISRNDFNELIDIHSEQANNANWKYVEQYYKDKTKGKINYNYINVFETIEKLIQMINKKSVTDFLLQARECIKTIKLGNFNEDVKILCDQMKNFNSIFNTLELEVLCVYSLVIHSIARSNNDKS